MNFRCRGAVLPRILAVVVVVGILASLLGFAWYILDQARSISKPPAVTKAPPPKPASSDLTPVERRYLDALATRLDLPFLRENPANRRVLQLAVLLNSERNARTPLNLDPARTPWLLPFPLTRSVPDLANPKDLPLDLASGQIELPADPAFYQYEIANPSPSPQAMPILFQDLRWDDAEALIVSAGLREIPDELDRAIAIWRLVAGHRYHAEPPTEGAEEHDLIKFLSCHGYGFCDDSAQAVATLAQACNLQVRITGLTGHVVPEIFANGQWHMFDADFGVYFHAADQPRQIFGLEQLTQNRAAFTHSQTLGPGGPYDAAYAAPFLSTQDNGPWPIAGATAHRIQHQLTAGERVVFTNYNWGRPFLGTSPQRLPRYYNGYFERPLSPSAWTLGKSCTATTEGSAIILENHEATDTTVQTVFESPFPIVAAQLLDWPENLTVTFEDVTALPAPRQLSFGHPSNPAGQSPQTNKLLLDEGIAQITETPTYRFRLLLTIPQKSRLTFPLPPKLRVDFQFAEFALLKLKPGPNAFHTFGPTSLKATLHYQPRREK